MYYLCLNPNVFALELLFSIDSNLRILGDKYKIIYSKQKITCNNLEWIFISMGVVLAPISEPMAIRLLGIQTL